MPITANTRGTSTTSDAGIPASFASAGMSKGLIEIAAPETRTRLNMFAPIMLPRERAPCPFVRAVIAVTSSGRDVAIATT